jgi:tellurite methyltransferase
MPSRSVSLFDEHFRRPPDGEALKLNPFEEEALLYLRGDVLDFGCGLDKLAFAAARRGCRVTALDASPAAIFSDRLSISAARRRRPSGRLSRSRP